MSKRDPSRPMKGDWVRIDNPEMFVRCGYPLSVKNVRKEIRDKYKQDIKDFIKRIILEKTTDNEWMRDDKKLKFHSNSMKKIIEALAYEKMKAENFGGRDRTIHTHFMEEKKGIIYEVVDTKRVVTGRYIPAYKAYDGYYGGYEYEPPYLDGQTHHRILILGHDPYKDHRRMLTSMWTGSWDDDMPDNMIEDCHVTKIPDPEEYIRNESKESDKEIAAV